MKALKNSELLSRTPKDKLFKMRTDNKMLEMLQENANISGNTKSDEVRIAIEERHRRLIKEVK